MQEATASGSAASDRRERRRVLILGVSGQDGALLARHLIAAGDAVEGTSRDGIAPNLARVGVAGAVPVHRVDPLSASEITTLVETLRPDRIYHLSGQSSVGRSFSQPRETYESHVRSTLNILEAVRTLRPACRVFVASSGEVFGETALTGADERAPFAPVTPYGVAKAAAASLVANYRGVYGVYACSGLLFNHESELRPEDFIVQRIARGAVAIARGRADTLTLGNLDIVRDFGWAADYVDCMARMLEQAEPRDHVVATGIPTSLEGLVDAVFTMMGLDWHEHVRHDGALVRPLDIRVSVGDPQLAAERLGWRAETCMPAIAERLVDAAREAA